MQIRDLFAADVTRDIPPVVYFHEQSPQKLQAEVAEYFITGGYPEGDPRAKRYVPQYVHEDEGRMLKLQSFVSELGQKLKGAVLSLDDQKHIAPCKGEHPRRLAAEIHKTGGVSGQTLIATFIGPPYGYPSDLVRACCGGLLRAKQVSIRPEVGERVTSYRDAGVKEVFTKERAFRKAEFFPPKEDPVTPRDRIAIGKFFEAFLEAELTEEAVRALRDAAEVRDYQLVQLAEVECLSGCEADAEAIREHFKSETAWRGVHSVDDACERVRERYVEVRKGILSQQSAEAENAQARVRGIPGFEALTADQAHRVMKAILDAQIDTAPDAVSPTLQGLRDSFASRIGPAEELARDRLDEERNRSAEKKVVKVETPIRGRELESSSTGSSGSSRSGSGRCWTRGIE